MSQTAQLERDPVATQRTLERARESVDEFVRRWETFTSEWDREPFVCELCQERERRDATLFCDTGKYLPGNYNDTFWVCDECLGDREAPGFNRSLVFRRIDRTRPHVWSGSLQNDYRNGLLASDPVPDARFRLPDGLDPDAVDPDALAPLTQHWFGAHGPWAAFVGINIAAAPSMRSWLPLRGRSVIEKRGEPAGSEDTVSVPLVCCDADSAAWGCIVVAEFFCRGSMSRWTRLADSLEALGREGSTDRLKQCWHARITGAPDAAPPPKPVPFNQTHLASIITGTDMFAAITGAPPRASYPW